MSTMKQDTAEAICEKHVIKALGIVGLKSS